MDQIWIHLLSLSGLLSLTLCKPREYVLIKELMTWEKAQDYCRKNHTDLATVQTDEDWTILQEVADKERFSGYAWIGLYNDINSWRWSYQDESLVFTSWNTGQPDNYPGQECGGIYVTGTWSNYDCDLTKYFVCYDENANATEKLVSIKMSKTWRDAQEYCRQRYTDLATVRSKDDNDQIVSMLMQNFLYESWIGLYRDSWKWSDQANFTSSTQLAVQKHIGVNEHCADTDYYRNIYDYYCTEALYFYCSTVKLKRQVIRVQVKASENADDATLSALLLHKLQQTLSDQDVTLTWRKQPNRKVFQKKKTTVQKTSKCQSFRLS